jgi:hypothetical protein
MWKNRNVSNLISQKKICKGLPPTSIKFEFLNAPERVRKPQAVMGAMTVRPIDEVTCNMVNNQCQIQHFQVPKKFCKGLPPTLIKLEFLNAPERVRKPQAVMGAMTVRPTDGVTCNMVSKQCQIQHFLVPKKFCKGLPPTLIEFEFLNDPERVRKPQAVMGAIDGVICNMVSKQC